MYLHDETHSFIMTMENDISELLNYLPRDFGRDIPHELGKARRLGHHGDIEPPYFCRRTPDACVDLPGLGRNR